MKKNIISVPKIERILKLMLDNDVLAFELGDFKVTFEDRRNRPSKMAPPPQKTPITKADAEIVGITLPGSLPINPNEKEPTDEELLFASSGSPGHIRERK